MARMIMGAFETPAQADEATKELEYLGYTPEEVSVISKSEHNLGGRQLGRGVAVGATTGGTLGGITGLVAGIGLVPVLAGLFIAGPAVTALGVAGIAVTGAVTGAAAGSLIGALTSLGMPRHTAESYEHTVEAGGVLVGLQEKEGSEVEQVQGVFDRTGAQNVNFIAIPLGDEVKAEVIEDPQEYLVNQHLPVFGETLDKDYYDGDRL